jgi:hypothetical protein
MKYIIFVITSLLFNQTAFSSEFSPSFENILSFEAGMNPNALELNAISNLNFSYAKKRTNFWLDFNIQLTSGAFQKLTMNNVPATTQTNATLFNSPSTHSSYGIGGLIESNYSQTFFGREDLYEITQAFLTYNIFKTNMVNSTFTGPGLLAKFSVCKKFSDYISVGANLNYSLASVQRPILNATETTSNQSLTLSYITLGIDFIFKF